MHLGATHFYNLQIRKGGGERGRVKSSAIFSKQYTTPNSSDIEESIEGLSPRGCFILSPSSPHPQPHIHKEETEPNALEVSRRVKDILFISE